MTPQQMLLTASGVFALLALVVSAALLRAGRPLRDCYCCRATDAELPDEKSWACASLCRTCAAIDGAIESGRHGLGDQGGLS